MFKWESVRLGDVVNVNMSSYSAKENLYFVNYLDTGNITNGVIDEIQYINLMTDKLPSRAKRKVKYNSILFSTVRPNQRHFGIVKSMPENFLVSTGFAVIDVLEDKVDADYLYFYLSQDSVIERLHAIAEQSVSAYPSIKPSDIENLHIELPPLVVQKSISSVLKSITDKISINTEINDNLEKQITAIYKQKFSYVLQGNNETVEQIVSFSNGKKRPNEEGTIPVYGGNGILAYTNKYNSNNCIIIGRVGAYCGNVSYSPKECWVSDNAIEAKSKISDSQLFAYYLLKNAELPTRHIGTGQPLMTQGILNAIPCSLPELSEIEAFNTLCEPLYQKIVSNLTENVQLTTLRETILPKLLSGEIDVTGVEF